MKRHLVTAAAFAMLATLAASCGSDSDLGTTDSSPSESERENESPADALGDDTVVFVWAETGGCAMAGPNCARYEVTADGTVTTFRENADAAAATGTVDVALVEEWIGQLEATDIAALTDRLGPGELTAAFDGVDNTVSAPHLELELSSVDYEFDSGQPFFAAAEALLSAAQEAAPLDVEMRE